MQIVHNFTVCYDMRFSWYATRFQCNDIRFQCYAMRNWNEVPNDVVCYAILWYTFEFWTKRLYSQKSFKHFKVKWLDKIKVLIGDSQAMSAILFKYLLSLLFSTLWPQSCIHILLKLLSAVNSFFTHFSKTI